MKKRTIFSIFLITFMVLSLTVFSGCDVINSILTAEPPMPESPYEPTEYIPEPEVAEETDSDEPVMSAWQQRLGSWPRAFGFANEEGNKLIHVFYDYESDEEIETETETETETEIIEDTDDEVFEAHNYFAETGFDPDVFTIAIGPFGDIFQISFSNWQNEKYGNSGREIANNFNNLPGFVYTQKEWDLTKNKTYLMTEMGMLLDNIIAIGSPVWRGNTPPMEEETIASIEKYKERKVEWGKTLAVTFVGDALIGLVLYERQGDDMLFSVVYMDDNKALFWDNPAVYDEESTWRVDAGEEPGQIEPLLLARFDEGLLMMLTWTASDGDIVVTLYEEDGVFKQAKELTFYRKTIA